MDSFNIENLTFTYSAQSNPALKNISIDIKAGEFILLCGQSGCGKTTLLKSLKPALMPCGSMSGKVMFEGREVRRDESAEEIGFVMQDPQAGIVTDKVWHELAFGLESMGKSQDEIRIRVAETADFFGLAKSFHKDISTLSGGQMQLLNLAAVMAMQPRVLLLDEPTSRLDPIAASEFLRMVRKINLETGTTVILSEQRLEEAMTMCDRAVVMDGGSIVAQGTPREVGEALCTLSHEMITSLPTPMRVYAAVQKNEYPVSVREGRAWLSDILSETPAKSVLHAEKERSGQSSLQMIDVCFSYGEHEVLKNLCLDVRKGEIYGLLGANGAGKSTMLSIICGLLKPVSGKILIDGKRMSNIKNMHDIVAAVPQEPRTLFLKNTVREDLELMQGDSQKSDVEEIMQLCGIEDLSKRHPYDISGGELQRAALAKVLLKKPSLLLLDEPTKGMDASCKQHIGEILRTLAQSGTTILLVSHDTEFCAEFCDRCAMVFDGAIVQESTPYSFFADKSFYTTAANRMARGMISDAVLANDIIVALGGRVQKKEYRPPKKKITEKKEEYTEDKPKEKHFCVQMVRALFMYLFVVPLTIFCGMYFLNDRKFYFISLLIIIETIVPFFFVYERRRPKAREIAVLATLCAVCVMGRTAFYMLPQIKPVLALIIICGAGMGAQSGFLIGAVTAFVSNMFFGQGAWTPWQMFAFGITGFIAGILFNNTCLKKTKTALCIYAGLSSVLIYGVIMNMSSALMWQAEPTVQTALPVFIAGMPFDIVLAFSSVLFMFIAGMPMLRKIERINRRIG